MTALKKATPKITLNVSPKKEVLRPRTAYNYFYSYQRDLILKEKKNVEQSINDDFVRMNKNGFNSICCNKLGRHKRQHRKTHGLIGLQELTRTVAKKWKETSKETKKFFKVLADNDKRRYQMEMDTSKHIPSKTKDGIEAITSADIIQSTRDFEVLVSNIDQEYSDLGYELSSLYDATCSTYTDKLGLTWSDEELKFLRYIAKEC